jgi:hypothetical protein
MKNYTKVKQKRKKPLENLHMEQWHEHYQLLVRSKLINGNTEGKELIRAYNNFILNEFSKNLKLA